MRKSAQMHIFLWLIYRLKMQEIEHLGKNFYVDTYVTGV